MRKIYSLVLMATMLLVGTTVKAADFTGSTGADLQTAITAILNGDTNDSEIKLTQNVSLGSDETMWVGTVDLNAASYKSIVIDLNGYTITKNAASTSTTYNMFVLTHGELIVKNTATNEAKIHMTGSGHYNSSVFFICGSYRSSRWNADGTDLSADSINTRTSGYVTHLEIGDRVTLLIDAQGTALNINNIIPNVGTTLSYQTNLLKDGNGKMTNDGFAYGIAVDVKGKIYVNGIAGTSSKSYGIKTNGTVQSPSNIDPTKLINSFDGGTTTVNYLTNYASHNGIIDKTVANNKTHLQDTIDAPYIHVHPQAYIYSRPTGDKSTAVYASGYAKWLIEGTCEGKTGVYISSGEVDFNNANISSNYTGTYVAPGAGGSANGGGSGIVVNSRSGSYSGDIDVTISGDTRVEGTSGYAVDEVVNTKPHEKKDETGQTVTDPETGEPVMEKDTKVQGITINGGTFEGGEKGAIAVSEETKVASEDGTKKTEVVIYGGNIDGTTQVGESGNLRDITPSGYHNTEVTVDGKTTVVISQGNPPTTQTLSSAIAAYNTWAANPGEDLAPSAKIDEAINTTLSQNLVFSELELNSSNYQQIIIPEGKSLTVSRLIMGENVVLVVEPGARLVVNGAQGVVAPVVTNLILRVNEDKQGALLFNPAVSSNRQPYATVQLYTKAYQMTPSDYNWHRFTMPLAEVTGYTYSQGSIPTFDGSAFFTSISPWDYVNQAWGAPLTNVSQMNPFEMYDMTNNAAAEGVRYNFKGRIQGTVSEEIPVKTAGWNYFGNAYTGTISIKAMLENIGNDNVEKTVYVWNSADNKQNYTTVTYDQLVNTPALAKIDTVAALKTLVFKVVEATGTVKLDYKKSVWDFMTKSPAPAPQRSMSNYNSVRINVTTENGWTDDVTFVESDRYSDEYESGADAEKLMNVNNINIYALTDRNQAIVATDNMNGTLLSLQTQGEVSYTFSFDNVNGEVYALRDNLTNTVVMMNEGATYNFTAQSNATLDGRFQIVSRQEMPTAVETVEETVNASKAIYTIMGQYVGETTDWNNLPAGVYVIDGVKVIK